MRISLILTEKKSMVARLNNLGYKFVKVGRTFFNLFGLTKSYLCLWTNLIETILLLFCSLFMLVSLYFVHKKLFSIIFTCLNMSSLFCDKIFMSQTTSKF